MAQVVSTLRRRVDPAPLTGLVAAGDVLLILLWVAIGQQFHGAPPLEYPGRLLGNVAPFLIGWTITAFVGGLYTSDAWEFPIRAVSWTVPAWTVTVVIAVLLRGTALFPGTLAPVFGLVSLLVGLTFLVPWRVLVSVFGNRTW